LGKNLKIISMYKTIQSMKYLNINIPWYLQDYMLKSIKYWWKKSMKTNQWRHILCSWTRKFNTFQILGSSPDGV
jgi:hypothetical protein